jgi:hypothetical protein
MKKTLLVLVIAPFLASVSLADEYDLKYDLKLDGEIDIYDVTLMASNYGKEAKTYEWLVWWTEDQEEPDLVTTTDDVTGDGWVDIYDAVSFAARYGAKSENPPYRVEGPMNE